jgi:hydrogenase/urease accessory protein HupE
MSVAFARHAFALLLGLVLAFAELEPAKAHELDSATLVLSEISAGRFDVRLQTNSEALRSQITAPASFPSPCRLVAERLDCGDTGLVGTIEFPWLEGRLTSVLVDIRWLSGARLLRMVNPSSPTLAVYGIPVSAGLLELGPIIRDYVRLGVEHILLGFDHLLFVIALTVLVRGRAALLLTITAFTLSHSLSLTATVLGVVSIPIAPVEAAIALSIALLCVECLRPVTSLTRRAPWAVAFAFGLLHGLGFASALLAIGLPEEHVPVALFCFNAGVELGQIAVVVAVVTAARLATRLKLVRPWSSRAVLYAMGSMAAFWTIERADALFRG